MTLSLTHWLTDWLTDSLSHFCFLTLKSDPRDHWPLRHLITVMRKHDLTNILTIFDNFDNFWQFLTILTIFDNFDNFWQFLTILTIMTTFDNFWQFMWSFQCFWKFLWPETWHLRHWLHFWQLRTTTLTITLWPLNREWWWQHSQFLRCFLRAYLILIGWKQQLFSKI